MGRRSRDTRDTHGTHGRRKAHGSHRRTSQPRTIQTHQQHTSSARSATTEAGKPRYCTTSRVPPVSLEAGATYKHIFYMSSGSGLRVYLYRDLGARRPSCMAGTRPLKRQKRRDGGVSAASEEKKFSSSNKAEAYNAVLKRYHTNTPPSRGQA